MPWTNAVGARNFIAHGYDRVDYGIVWDTIATDFAPLVSALEGALGSDAG
ncbi:MAG: DUF86 domain-containing protein [Candidatus Rokubacteria bacterium]|nr:DUF86 domain-containing protein [Candidatus Rokubacteria bacterium]